MRSDGLRLPIIFQRSSLWVEVEVFWFSSVLTVWWLSHAPFMDPFQNATFDPWSGKSLGEVEKPQGFDDYWKDQEACSFFKLVNRSLSVFMHLYLWERWLRLRSLFCREALLLEAVQRGEKEPEELDPVGEKKGKGRGKGGKGFRRSRYNVVPKPPPRARPTHFVAIRLFSRMNFELHFRRFVCKCFCCSIRWWLLFRGLFVPSFELSTSCFRFFITFFITFFSMFNQGSVETYTRCSSGSLQRILCLNIAWYLWGWEKCPKSMEKVWKRDSWTRNQRNGWLAGYCYHWLLVLLEAFAQFLAPDFHPTRTSWWSPRGEAPKSQIVPKNVWERFRQIWFMIRYDFRVRLSKKNYSVNFQLFFLEYMLKRRWFLHSISRSQDKSRTSRTSRTLENQPKSLCICFYFPMHTGYDLHLLKACHEAGEEIRDFLGDQPVKIVASGISSFNGQTLALTKKTRGFQI